MVQFRIERVLLQEKLPGWMYQIKQGATSIWERWNAMAENGSIHDPGMNSFNHYAFGSVCEFIFENIICEHLENTIDLCKMLSLIHI